MQDEETKPTEDINDATGEASATSGEPSGATSGEPSGSLEYREHPHLELRERKPAPGGNVRLSSETKFARPKVRATEADIRRKQVKAGLGLAFVLGGLAILHSLG